MQIKLNMLLKYRQRDHTITVRDESTSDLSTWAHTRGWARSFRSQIVWIWEGLPQYFRHESEFAPVTSENAIAKTGTKCR